MFQKIELSKKFKNKKRFLKVYIWESDLGPFWRHVWNSVKVNSNKYFSRTDFGAKTYVQKVQRDVLATIQVKSRSCSCNEIWILRPFSKAAEKTWSCFVLDTEQQYWTVTVQYLCRVKQISMTSNVLSLHFALSQASSSQKSNVDKF